MKNITLWQRLRQVSISTSLRCAFLMGALLTLIVSSVSLYSWHEQSSQIRYSLDEYFPRIHSAFLIEGNLNLVVDQLNEFLQAPNTTVRLQLRTQIIQHLDTIERLSRGLSSRERQQLTVILRDSRSLLNIPASIPTAFEEQCNGGGANGNYSLVQSRRSCSASGISPVCEACWTLPN